MIFKLLSGGNMKNYTALVFVILTFLSGCLSSSMIDKAPVKHEVLKEAEKNNFWLDQEAGTVHTIVSENGEKKVVSIIKYKKGNILEVMKILTSENINGQLHWIYFSPSTKYIVELTAVSNSEKGIAIKWKNKNPQGEEKSGTDIFVKCNENGFIEDRENTDAKEPGVKDDFTLFKTIK